MTHFRKSILYDALAIGKVAGAAIDVFEKDSPEDNKLLELDNVLPTPQLGALTKEALLEVALDDRKKDG